MTGNPKRPAVVRAAPAKLNLWLHVLGRRDDGYHLLDSLVAFAGVHDRVVAAPAGRLELRLSGPFARHPRLTGAAEDNLVMRAARALAGACGVTAGARLTLEKNLPVAAGIGGGSADAAAALRALVALWQVSPGAETMRTLAAELGADVPVCLLGRACFVGGIGDELEPAPALPPAGLVLVNPGVPLETARVFAHPAVGRSAGDRFDAGRAPADAQALAELLAVRTNDLATAAGLLVPEIADAMAALASAPGALLARMSGSGATCFGLFPDENAAQRAATGIRRAQPRWWVVATRLVDDCGRIAPGR